MTMDKNTNFGNLPNEQNNILTSDNFCLTDSDFYPPCDYRVWQSNVEDIDDGDNFADYCEDFFELLDEEEYYND